MWYRLVSPNSTGLRQCWSISVCPAAAVVVKGEEEVRKKVRMKMGQLVEDAAVGVCMKGKVMAEGRIGSGCWGDAKGVMMSAKYGGEGG